MSELLLGIDVGTYSSKGTLCRLDGDVVAESQVEHSISVPQPGYMEQDANLVWWADVKEVAKRLTGRVPDGDRIAAVSLSAIGPCLLPVDEEGEPLRAGILYGVDTRASTEIEELEARFGRADLVAHSGMRLTSQAVGPKIRWLRRNEPEVFQSTRWFHTASSWLVYRLTGRHVIDRHTASHFNPLYELETHSWSDRFSEDVVDLDRLPELCWGNEIVGTVTKRAAEETGIAPGTPVTGGTVDAVAEAISVGATEPGDLMLMYGSTAFLILVAERQYAHGDLWVTDGAIPGRRLLAGGMATTGSATTWFLNEFARELSEGRSRGFEDLTLEAGKIPPGADGVLFLPYLSGERTPLHDPHARGVIAGLSLGHSRGHVFRSLLEGSAFGIRQILETMAASGAPIRRLVAVGGGATSPLWPQIVSDVIGRPQELPQQVIGASYGDAYLAGLAVGIITDDTLHDAWVGIDRVIEPDDAQRSAYEYLYREFLALYSGSAQVVHALASWQDQQRRGDRGAVGKTEVVG